MPRGEPPEPTPDIEPVDFALGSPSLDEVFFALTGRAGETAAQGDPA